MRQVHLCWTGSAGLVVSATFDLDGSTMIVDRFITTAILARRRPPLNEARSQMVNLRLL